MQEYLPEGELIYTTDNKNSIHSLKSLDECISSQKILESGCTLCDNEHNLYVDFGFAKGIIPRTEGAIGIAEGTTKDIALISRVNKVVCFVVLGFQTDKNGKTMVVLSRKKAQENCYKNYIKKLIPGDVIKVKVSYLEQFGSFVDVGCGVPSLIPIDSISISRISNPSDRFFVGQKINAVVKSVDDDKIYLSHKELLGTWEENVKNFKVGETVSGIVRSVESYGIFIELAPNLAGLAELKAGVSVNEKASVYIKAIIPEKNKIKLVIIDTFESGFIDHTLKYYIDSGHVENWVYSTKDLQK